MSQAHQIESQAAHWLARKDDAEWTLDDQAELDAWLDASHAHKAAFWRLEEGWRRADRISALGLTAPAEGRNSSLTRFWKPAAVAASLCLATWVGVTVLSPQREEPRGQQIATIIGARKVLPLSDGSQIELNTATTIRASVTEQAREVWLERGEAFFDVHHSRSVPFVVHAGVKTITVMGTKFSVRRDGDKVTVAVLEGRVRVTDGPRVDGGAAVVPAGSIAVTEPQATLVTGSALKEVNAQMAWRHGELVFSNDTLADAAAEFNRYSERKIVVRGKAAELKVGGSFKASNVDGFSRLLRDAYGLNVRSNEGQIVVTD